MKNCNEVLLHLKFFFYSIKRRELLNLLYYMFKWGWWWWLYDDTSRFYTEQQATNLAVLFAARSLDLEVSMCRQLREMGGGVDDVHCCASFITRKQLITAVSPSLHLWMSRWATRKPLRSRRCSHLLGLCSCFRCPLVVVVASYEQSLLSN